MKTMGSGKTFAAAALALGAGGVAHAGFLDNVNYSFGGFVRAEVATRTTSLENPNNQNGNTFNNVDAERQAFLPPKLAVNAIRWGAIPLGVDISGLPVIGQVIPAVGFSDTIRRSDFVATHDNNFNYTVLRAEGELGIRFGRKFRIIGRLRALYHPDDVIDGFDEQDPTSAREDVREEATQLQHTFLDKLASKSDLSGIRIGIPKELFPAEVSQEARRVIDSAAACLSEKGAQIVPVSLPCTPKALSAYYVLALAEASSNLARYDGAHYGFSAPDHDKNGQKLSDAARREMTRSLGFGEEVKKRMLLGTYALTAE